MLRKGITAALLAGWLATPVQASLQGSLRAASQVLSNISTTFAPNNYGIDTRSYDDFLFVDPVASTKSTAVYRDGPELEYNSLTGGLSIIAPPLLGPADEFGNREELSPRSISIYTSGFLIDSPTFPKVRKYQRDMSISDVLSLEPDERASFHRIDDPYYSMSISDTEVGLSLGHSGLMGDEVHFSTLLSVGLGPEFYNAAYGFVSGINLWPVHEYRYNPNTAPDVHVKVHYERTSYRYNRYDDFIFLAVPKVIPEPATSLFVLMASTMLLSRRTRRD